MDKFSAAIQQVAHEHGVERLAGDMGVNYNVLLNQLNPNNDRPISLRKFYQLVRFTKDQRLLNPLLDMLGLVATRHEVRDDDASFFDLMVNHQVAFGAVAETIRDAMKDGMITGRERQDINKVVQQEIDALCDLRAELNDMADLKAVGQ